MEGRSHNLRCPWKSPTEAIFFSIGDMLTIILDNQVLSLYYIWYTNGLF